MRNTFLVLIVALLAVGCSEKSKNPLAPSGGDPVIATPVVVEEPPVVHTPPSPTPPVEEEEEVVVDSAPAPSSPSSILPGWEGHIDGVGGECQTSQPTSWELNVDRAGSNGRVIYAAFWDPTPGCTPTTHTNDRSTLDVTGVLDYTAGQSGITFIDFTPNSACDRDWETLSSHEVG